MMRCGRWAVALGILIDWWASMGADRGEAIACRAPEDCAGSSPSNGGGQEIRGSKEIRDRTVQ